MRFPRLRRGRRAIVFLFLAVAITLLPVLSPAGAAGALGLEQPDAGLAASGKGSPALVLLKTADSAGFEAVLDFARAQGAAVTLAYPPDAFIAELAPGAAVALRQHPSVARVETSAVAAGDLQTLDRTASTAARAWNDVYNKAPDPLSLIGQLRPTPLVPDGAVRLPPSGTAIPSPQASGAQGAAPSAAQTSEFMAGSVVASVVFVESNGGSGNCKPADANARDWSDARKAEVMSKVSEGLAFWTTRAGRPDPLTFVVEDLGATLGKVAATSCEPIARPTSDDSKWIADALSSLGYAATTSSYFSVARSVADSRRVANHADWGYVIFVVDSLGDSDGQFSDFGFAYAYLSGPFMVMTYDNDGWNISRTNYVVAHETGHIFGALDEYAGSGCSTSDTWGYFSVANASCNNGGITTDYSIMGESNEQMAAGSDVSASARAAIGWRNPGPGAGGKTVVDVVRTSTVSLTPFSPDPTVNPTPTYSATAGNTAYPAATACNKLGNTCYRYPVSTTISKVGSAEWGLDGGASTTAGVTATDGAFDQASEAYTFTPRTSVADGAHTFATHSVNSFGHVSADAADTLTIGSGGVPNNPPRAPASPSPANSATLVAPTAVLSWTGGDPDVGDTVAYTVYLGTANPPTSAVCAGVASALCDPPGDLLASTLYYWRVVATDSHGAVTQGPIWSFTTAAAGCPAGQFTAKYFNNLTMTGTATYQTCEAAPLTHQWGRGGPGNGIGVDNFSARYEGVFTFKAARYSFTVTADDGIRVYIDNVLLINKWTSATTRAYTATKTLTAGTHTVKVEYVEKKNSAYVTLSWK